MVVTNYLQVLEWSSLRREDKPSASDRSHPTTMVSYLKTWLGLMDMWLGMVKPTLLTWMMIFGVEKIAANMHFVVVVVVVVPCFFSRNVGNLCLFAGFCFRDSTMGFITIFLNHHLGDDLFYNCSNHLSQANPSNEFSGFHANKTHHFAGETRWLIHENLQLQFMTISRFQLLSCRMSWGAKSHPP